MTLRSPPTPPGHFLLGNTLQYLRSPLEYVTRWSREQGDVVRLRLPGLKSYLVTHPEHVETVLRGQHRNFIKDKITRRLTSFLGQGLLTSEGDFWRRQRRLAQPGFQGHQIERYAGVMTSLAEGMLNQWRPGQPRNFVDDMMGLALAVFSKSLLDADMSGDVRAVGQVMHVVMGYFENPAVNWSSLPLWLPVPANLRFRRAVRRLDEIIYRIIGERRRTGHDPGDVLSRLLSAQDDDGSRMSERQVRDELVTLLLAGHETTALTLSYCCYLLAKSPAAEQALTAELDQVLQGRQAMAADLPNLQYAEWVVKESMRLYPPAWALGREAVDDCQLGGYDIPARSQIWLSQWVVHRDPRWYERAEDFWPERWENDLARRLPRGTYFPFGDGPRVCIGSQFAMTEAVLILATIFQRFRFDVVSNLPLELSPSITLRPKRGIQLVPQTRRSA